MTHLYDVFPSGSEVRRRTLAQMPLAVLTSGELELSMSVSGFDVEAMYGGFDLAAYDHLSPRAILVARRRGLLVRRRRLSHRRRPSASGSVT